MILYHPSHEVVATAIDIFSGTERDDVLDYSDRLLKHEYASVRSAIVRAIADEVGAMNNAYFEGEGGRAGTLKRQ